LVAFAVGSPGQTLRTSFQPFQLLAQHRQGVCPFDAALRTPVLAAAPERPGRWVCRTSVPLLLCLLLTRPVSPDFTARCRHRRRLRPSALKRWPTVYRSFAFRDLFSPTVLVVVVRVLVTLRPLWSGSTLRTPVRAGLLLAFCGPWRRASVWVMVAPDEVQRETQSVISSLFTGYGSARGEVAIWCALVRPSILLCLVTRLVTSPEAVILKRSIPLVPPSRTNFRSIVLNFRCT
jgi:hypothetical protein